jgi:hypothetical protein
MVTHPHRKLFEQKSSVECYCIKIFPSRTVGFAPSAERAWWTCRNVYRVFVWHGMPEEGLPPGWRAGACSMRKDYNIALNVTEMAVDDPDVAFYENYVCGAARNYIDYRNAEVDKLRSGGIQLSSTGGKAPRYRSPECERKDRCGCAISCESPREKGKRGVNDEKIRDSCPHRSGGWARSCPDPARRHADPHPRHGR